MGISLSYGEGVGLLCAFIWALNSLIVRTQSQKVPPALMNAVRCAVAGALFWTLLPFGPPLSTYGAVTGRVKNVMIAGNIFDLFREDVRVSADTDYDGRLPHAVIEGVHLATQNERRPR